ncbi:cleavage polyadenylation factor subunit fip1 [Claviceps purpurea]|nr:cleavage polyadenylation factor subunit fip1 [Claviceps purpurea]KAG6182114.1 cleavage polyadenylation factor subunit fip1 [Claviceps purpurea]KAG6222532.1 cleavage polyadenylation factor subunit fip1 [Claviceps purpurea]KAG6227312.1 cleavage polyadenylation factor subunit fip1 [Claviceps purpurea]KAG6240819.1 cleavage polyadenylation factor subunit fip1 [Claviceps purpurea]
MSSEMSEHDMEMDEGDDLYEPEEPKIEASDKNTSVSKSEELEEGEEEDEGGAMDEDDDDSDIDIITERKDGTTAAPPTQFKYSDIRNIPQRTTSGDSTSKPPPVKKEEKSKSTRGTAANVATPSADQASAAASKSTIDINANPVYPSTGKPITQVNIDEDLAEKEKPWRKPGTDISDYFNYGFDEFTWALYAAKQESIRGEFGADTFATNNKKMMEEFNNMMMMGGGMGMPGAGAGGGAVMPGMDGMPPDMQAMMQQMMASGMDPSQMDPSQMNAMFSGMQAGGAGPGMQGNQGQNFGGGFGGNQGVYGYDQGMSAGGGGRGGFGGGRGRRGRW